jgi:hypothetical protein
MKQKSNKIMAYYLGRLTPGDMANIQQFQALTGLPAPTGDPRSFRYEDARDHIPVQRSMHQTASYAYRTNQMIKHAVEDGHMNVLQANQHADTMYSMSDRDAFLYAQQTFGGR